jgi:pyrroloquinoline quinone biosynthesis protein B
LHLRILGTAAGGAFPQWNCACRLCQGVRSNRSHVASRLHAGLAVSAGGENWHLVNATPDVAHQVESFPPLHPRPTGHSASSARQTPIRGILLTDAELDHTLGLLVLREGTSLDIYATSAVLGCLSESFPVQEILQTYTSLRWREVKPLEAFALEDGRMRVRAIPLGMKQPRYAIHSKVEGDWVIGYRFEDTETNRAVVYAPSIEQWSQELRAALAAADCILVDGTFWTDDEMIRAGVGDRTAQSMGHLPISGEGGSAGYLSALHSQRKIYIHVNNTNPVLEEDSTERRYLAERGIEVGWDGMDLEV